MYNISLQDRMIYFKNSRVKNFKLFIPVVFLIGVIASCQSTQTSTDFTQINKSDRGKKLVAEEAMVSSAHPLASEAGLKMLEKGGNAIDAAVATAFALHVVEPNMSGIGGGGSMMMWKQEEEQASYVDFYSAKKGETYKNIDYEAREEDEFNLLPTGVPGTVDGLLQALERHGTMSRTEVMAPAIEYATEGFPVYLTLAEFIRDSEEKLKRFEGAKETFWPEGEPLNVGEILKQPQLAQTLQNISDEGPSAFYEGKNAEDMVEVLNEHHNPVTEDDFAEYEPQWDKQPLSGTYNNYNVISAPLPQTGFYIIQALNLLERYDLAEEGLPTESAHAFDIITSTLRASIADRVEYVTDPNWKEVPVDGLISKEYASKRSELVGTGSPEEEIKYGDPSSISQDVQHDQGGSTHNVTATSMNSSLGDDAPVPRMSNGYKASVDEAAGTGETTHISIVDPDGNAVSLSTTLSPVFGSGAWVNGFILNDSGFNFSNLENEEDWESSHPYRIRASTISPTIILDEDKTVELVIGAPGGGRIPTAIVQNILYVLEYGLDPIDAVHMPRIFPSAENREVQIEKGFDYNILADAREMGYDIQTLSQGYARMYLVYNKNGQLIGVADPRHDGEVRGF